ncbi:hypothetical protein LOTGIDRAFT_238678 [Lottia gigantea]|uniref:C2H2-type domain-containing protein n=1 Tax=Lottia gigantea TaxID=225164 RepID=V4CE10_LOTGI|nr:hypothetical protein LOTGIDRAFT_238678 [Lottia gigantea]ESP00185.1 hypothetical protein LOTGIDRAFT_238678 [Lottia gigantea]
MSRFGGFGRGGPRFGADPYRQDAHWQVGSGVGGWPRSGWGRGGSGSQDNRQPRPRFSSRNNKYEPRFSGNNNNASPRPLLGSSPSTLLKSVKTSTAETGGTVTGVGNKRGTESSNSTQEAAGQKTKPLAVKSGLLPTPNISTADTKLNSPISNNGDSSARSKSAAPPTTTTSIKSSSSSITPTKSILKVSSSTSISKSSPSTTAVSTNSNVKASTGQLEIEKSSSSEEDDNYCSFCKIKFTSSENYTKHTRGLMHTQKVMEVENGKKECKEEPESSKDFSTPSGRSSQSFIKQKPKNTPTPKIRTENIKLKSIFDHKPNVNQKEDYGYGDDRNYQGQDQEFFYDKDPALAKYGLSKELLDTANLEPVIKPPKERDLNPEECGKKRFHTDYHCKLCNVKCTGAQSFQAHLAGNKHSTNVDNYYTTGKSTVKRTDVSLVPCNRKSLTKELTSINTEPIVGLSYVTEFHKEDAKAVVNCVCNLCESKCDEHTIVPHLLGSRHRLNYMKEHHIEFHDHCKKYGGKKNQTQYIAELTADIEKIDGKGEPAVKMCVEEKFVEEIYASETLLTTRRPPLLKRPGPAGDKLEGAKRNKFEAYDESENYQSEEYGDYGGYNEPMKKGSRHHDAVPSNDFREDYGDEQYGQDHYGNEEYGSGQYGGDQYSNKQYDPDSNEKYCNDQYTNDQFGVDRYVSDGMRRDEYPHGRGEREEEKDRFSQEGYLTKEDIYRMDPYSEHSNDGYPSTELIVKEYGHAKEAPRSLMDDFLKSEEPLLDEFPQSRDRTYGGYSKFKEPLIRNPPLLGRDPEPLLKDLPILKEPLLKNPPVSREPLMNLPFSGPVRQPLLQSPEGEYGQGRSWDNTDTQQSHISRSWDNGGVQQSHRSTSWDKDSTQPSQNSQSDYSYSGHNNYRPPYKDSSADRYSGYLELPNDPPVPPVPQEAPPLPSKSYEEELAERQREEKLIEERIEKEVQNRLQNILSMKKPDPDRKSSRSGGMSDMSVLMQSLSNSLISNEDEAEMALQVSNALTQALLKYRLKTLPPEMVKDALPNYGEIVSQLDVSQSPASSKSLKSTPATPDTSYLHNQNIPGLMSTSQWPVSSNAAQMPMQVDQYNIMSQWPQMVQPDNQLATLQQPLQSQYMQQQITPQSLMSQQTSSASQPLIIPSPPAQLVHHAMGYSKKKQSNPQNEQQFMSPSSSTPQMVPPISENVSGASNLGSVSKSYYSDVPPEYLHHRLLQGPPSVSRPQRRP